MFAELQDNMCMKYIDNIQSNKQQAKFETGTTINQYKVHTQKFSFNQQQMTPIPVRDKKITSKRKNKNYKHKFKDFNVMH